MSAPPDGDVSRAYVLTAASVSTTLIALTLTCLRVYVRGWMIKKFDWDDFFNVLAMMFVLTVMILNLGAVHYGIGRHFSYVGLADAAQAVKLLRICEFMLILSTVFLKISISLFLRRLFITSLSWRMFLWAFIAFNTLTSLLDAAIIFPQCTPVTLNWDHRVKGTCWSNEVINGTGITQGSIAAFTDCLLSIIPIMFLWNIRIDWKVKVGICGVMSLGFASGAFAVARTSLVPTLTVSRDPTWDLVNLFFYATLEATFGVIAAAAPAVRPLFGHNAMSSDYSRSNQFSVPLSSRAATTKDQTSKRRSQWPSVDDALFDDDTKGLRNGGAYLNLESQEGRTSSQVTREGAKGWSEESGGVGIVKTTDIDITHENVNGSGPDTTGVHAV